VGCWFFGQVNAAIGKTSRTSGVMQRHCSCNSSRSIKGVCTKVRQISPPRPFHDMKELLVHIDLRSFQVAWVVTAAWLEMTSRL